MKTLLILGAVLLAFGCGNSDAVISNNAVPPINIAPANTPQVIPSTGNANSNTTVRAPGIPSVDEIKKPFKPGATPTPGIPDDEKMRKLMGRPEVNVNVPTTKNKK